MQYATCIICDNVNSVDVKNWYTVSKFTQVAYTSHYDMTLLTVRSFTIP